MTVLNIEAYDVESLRKLVRLLEYENRILKEKLKRGIFHMMKFILLKRRWIMWKNMTLTKESVLSILPLSQRRWRNASFLCFGEEKTFMPSVERMVVISLNARADGMTGFAQSSVEKR